MGSRTEQKDEEQALVRAFLEVYPDFAGEEIREWSSAEYDPPDVICITASGKRLGVEVSQWAHEREFSAGSSRKVIERKLLAAIGAPQPLNTSKNFRLVVFHPRTKVDIIPRDYPVFRQSMLRLMKHVDCVWPRNDREHTYHLGDLKRFPPLDKHLEEIRFVPGEALKSDVDWIIPIGFVHTFDNRTMVDPLLQQLRKKATRCSTLKTRCDEVHLLMAYDQALLYCSPIETPRRSIDDIAKEAAAAFTAAPGPFSRGFLFIAGYPGRRVYRLL